MNAKFVKDHIKSYPMCNLVQDGNKFTLVNKFTGTIHTWSNGQTEITLSNSELKKLNL